MDKQKKEKKDEKKKLPDWRDIRFQKDVMMKRINYNIFALCLRQYLPILNLHKDVSILKFNIGMK